MHMHTKCSLFVLIHVVYIVRYLQCHYLYMQLYSYCIVASYIIHYACSVTGFYTIHVTIYVQMSIICTLIAVQWLIVSNEILCSYLVLVFFAYNKPSKCSLYICRKGGAMWLQVPPDFPQLQTNNVRTIGDCCIALYDIVSL